MINGIGGKIGVGLYIVHEREDGELVPVPVDDSYGAEVERQLEEWHGNVQHGHLHAGERSAIRDGEVREV